MSVQWNKTEIKRLVNFVRIPKILHDETIRANYTQREKIWTEVASRMGDGFTGSQCKLKFRSLKHAYFAKMKRGTVDSELHKLFSFLEQEQPQSQRQSEMGINSGRPARVAQRRSTILSRRASRNSVASRASARHQLIGCNEGGDHLTQFFMWCEEETRRYDEGVQIKIKKAFTDILTNFEIELLAQRQPN